MHHHHHHGHHHHHHHSTGNIKVAFFLNLGFAIIEIIGGIFTNSLAILSDALHDLGDSLSLGLAWYFQKYSEKGSDEKYTYGYQRFSLLGAYINTVILIIGSILIIQRAVTRILQPEDVEASGMILLAVLGILVNGAAVLKLQKGTSLNEKVVTLHLIEDILGWVVILLGSIIMYFVYVPILDPILSLGISVYILYNAFRNYGRVFKIFLQATPQQLDIQKVEEKILQIPEIESVHDLHLWSLDGEHHILTLHAVVQQEKLTPPENEKVKEQIREAMDSFHIQHVTIELECESEHCHMVHHEH